VIINRGTTRGDDKATIKLETGVSQALGYLAAELPSLKCRPNRFGARIRVSGPLSGRVYVRWLRRYRRKPRVLGL
jgi:hypothetical protein